jgi:hypothetical protein
MTDVDKFRELVRRFPRELPALIEFNYNLAADMHGSHRDTLMPEIPANIFSVTRCVPRISSLLLRRVGLLEFPCFDIPNPHWPLALLSVSRLERIARHVGALVLGIRVRSSLSRDHVLAWKARLGEEAYRFAMNSASLVQAGRLPLVELSSDAPEEIGYRVILAGLADAPETLSRRACLKIPRGLGPADIETEKANRLLKNVMGIVEAEWYSSFAAIRQ